MSEHPIVVAMTGASGVIYGVRLLDVLLAAGCDVMLSISASAGLVCRHELGLEIEVDDFRLDDLLPPKERWTTAPELTPLRALIAEPVSAGIVGAQGTANRVRYCHWRDFLAPMASGSARTGGMVVCPCSGGTMSAIAHASSGNLIHRAADVHLKERRKLILVPRETPLSTIQLDNMRRCAEAGAVVLPAMPGFYHGVGCLGDLVDFVVARICDQLGVEHSLARRWGENEGGAGE